MIDVVTVGAGGGSIAWLSPEGTLKVGPQSAGADPGPLCYGKGGDGGAVTITDAHLVLGRIPPHLLGGEIPLDVDAARAGRRAAGRHGSGMTPEAAAAGVLEISAWNQANALRQVTVKRGLDVRDFTLDDVRRLRLAAAVPADGRARHPDRAGAARPRQRLGVRAADGRRQERLRADPRDPRRRGSTRPRWRRRTTSSTGRARAALLRRGLRRGAARLRAHRRPALLRPGLRGAGAVPEGPFDADLAADGRRARSTPSTAPSTATTSPTTRASRSSGSTCGSPASARSSGPEIRAVATARAAWRRTRRPGRTARGRSASTPTTGTSTRRCSGGPTSAPGTTVTGPAIIEEYGSTVPLHPGFTARVDDYRNLIVTRSRGDR